VKPANCPLCGGPATNESSPLTVARTIRCARRGVAFAVTGPLLRDLAAPDRWREREALAGRICRSGRTDIPDVGEELAILGAEGI
jgi:hypothetical protein